MLEQCVANILLPELLWFLRTNEAQVELFQGCT